MRVQGRLIAFMGIPGSGKSSVAAKLAELAGGQAYHEPEESQWPSAIEERARTGYFTAISWFRSVRVPMLFDAHRDREAGRVAVVDSYYDKLLLDYMDAPGMAWLIPPADPYSELVRAMAELDAAHLPDADALVFLTVDQAVWEGFLRLRGRQMDGQDDFRTVVQAQPAFLQAARLWSQKAGASLVEHAQELSSPDAVARALLSSLQQKGVLRP